jgi:molybdate transport system substrate-binding protein
MRHGGVYERVKAKIVLGENVTQALQFAQTGAADAALVALSLASAPSSAASGKWWVVPEEMHPRLEQGGVMMRTAVDPAAAQAVRAFLLSADGQAILARHGFSRPGA